MCVNWLDFVARTAEEAARSDSPPREALASERELTLRAGSCATRWGVLASEQELALRAGSCAARWGARKRAGVGTSCREWRCALGGALHCSCPLPWLPRRLGRPGNPATCREPGRESDADPAGWFAVV